MQTVHLKRTKRILGGHLWVFSNEVYETMRGYVPGSLVELFDRQENFLGIGYINPNSLISIRILSRERVEIDREFLRGRLRAALDLREKLFEGRGGPEACLQRGGLSSRTDRRQVRQVHRPTVPYLWHREF